MMRRILTAFLFAAVAVGPAAASDQTDAMAQVTQFVNGLNKGDMASALATCAEKTAIIDEFPPYEWDGPGACANWANDFAADSKKNGITNSKITLGKTRHLDVTGDRAYYVAPVSYSFKMNGKPGKETGSTLAAVLHKGPAGWRIIAWTWSKR